MSHVGPADDAAQSAFVWQPQFSIVVLHHAPRGFVAQSALVTHPTHTDICVLHTAPVEQSALVVHLRWHRCHKVLQASWAAAGQSALVEQPQVPFPPFVALLHHAPEGFVAQSAFVTQT